MFVEAELEQVPLERINAEDGIDYILQALKAPMERVPEKEIPRELRAVAPLPGRRLALVRQSVSGCSWREHQRRVRCRGKGQPVAGKGPPHPSARLSHNGIS